MGDNQVAQTLPDGKKLPRILNRDFYTLEEVLEGGKTIRAKCVACHKQKIEKCYSASLNATSNFRSHYTKRHPKELELHDEQGRKRPKHAESDSNLEEKQEILNQNVIDYHVSNFMPSKNVEEASFIRLIKGNSIFIAQTMFL